MQHSDVPRQYVKTLVLPDSQGSEMVALPSNYQYEYRFLLISNFTAAKLHLGSPDVAVGWSVPAYSQRLIAMPKDFLEGFAVNYTANTDATNTQVELTFSKYPFGNTNTLSGF